MGHLQHPKTTINLTESGPQTQKWLDRKKYTIRSFIIHNFLPDITRMIKLRKENKENTQHSHCKNYRYKTFVTKPKEKKSLALSRVQRIIYARS